MEAYSQDELIAEHLPEPESSKPMRRMSEYSVEVEMLSTLVDRMSEMIQALLASRGVKPRRITPAPRPVTAYERIKKDRRKSQHESLVARLLPNKAKNQAAAPPAPARPRPRPARLERAGKPEPDKRASKPHRGFGS